MPLLTTERGPWAYISIAISTRLGFYNSNLSIVRWSKGQLVEMGNAFSAIIGLDTPPALLRKTVGKMGLKGVPGLPEVFAKLFSAPA